MGGGAGEEEALTRVWPGGGALGVAHQPIFEFDVGANSVSGQASFRAGQNIPVAQWFFDPDDRYFLLPPGIRENSMDLFGLAAATVDPSAFLSMCGTLSTQQSANFISEGRGVRAI